MNSRVRQAVMRILLLTEEFSAEELGEAISLIGGQKEDLLVFLKQMSSSPKRPPITRSGEPGIKRTGETRALQELKSIDSEKYQILRDFESAIREGRILKTLDDFRAFGTLLSKGFMPGKSRKEALSRLMAMLAHLDLDAIRAVIAKVPSRGSEDEAAFRRLANQIISGPHNLPSAADAG